MSEQPSYSLDELNAELVRREMLRQPFKNPVAANGPMEERARAAAESAGVLPSSPTPSLASPGLQDVMANAASSARGMVGKAQTYNPAPVSTYTGATAPDSDFVQPAPEPGLWNRAKKVVSNLGKSAVLGAEQTLAETPANYNKFLGLGATEATNQAFIAPAEARAAAAKKEFDTLNEGTGRWSPEWVANSVANSVGQLAGLPVDIAVGGMAKAATLGRKALEYAPRLAALTGLSKEGVAVAPRALTELGPTATAVEEAAQAVPNFAYGMGFRKAGEEGNPMGFFKGVAEGLAMHRVGEIGKDMALLPRALAQVESQAALGAGLTTADTLSREGRLPTLEEAGKGAITNAALALPFAVAPGKMGVEPPEFTPRFRKEFAGKLADDIKFGRHEDYSDADLSAAYQVADKLYQADPDNRALLNGLLELNAEQRRRSGAAPGSPEAAAPAGEPLTHPQLAAMASGDLDAKERLLGIADSFGVKNPQRMHPADLIDSILQAQDERQAVAGVNAAYDKRIADAGARGEAERAAQREAAAQPFPPTIEAADSLPQVAQDQARTRETERVGPVAQDVAALQTQADQAQKDIQTATTAADKMDAVKRFAEAVQAMRQTPALPAGQGFELVPEGMRRDLPVPSTAIPMEGEANARAVRSDQGQPGEGGQVAPERNDPAAVARRLGMPENSTWLNAIKAYQDIAGRAEEAVRPVEVVPGATEPASPEPEKMTIPEAVPAVPEVTGQPAPAEGMHPEARAYLEGRAEYLKSLIDLSTSKGEGPDPKVMAEHEAVGRMLGEDQTAHEEAPTVPPADGEAPELSTRFEKGITALSRPDRALQHSEDWSLAKSGDAEAADRVVSSVWGEKNMTDVAAKLDPAKETVFLTVPSSTGKNEIPKSLGRSLAERLGGEVVSGNDFYIAEHGAPVKSVPPAERPFSVREYSPLEGQDIAAKLAGKNVVVTEDVLTTGASAKAFVRALQRAGVKVDTVVGLMGDGRLDAEPQRVSKLQSALKNADIEIRAKDLAQAFSRGEINVIIDQINQARTPDARQSLARDLQRVLDERTSGVLGPILRGEGEGGPGGENPGDAESSSGVQNSSGLSGEGSGGQSAPVASPVEPSSDASEKEEHTLPSDKTPKAFFRGTESSAPGTDKATVERWLAPVRDRLAEHVNLRVVDSPDEIPPEHQAVFDAEDPMWRKGNSGAATRDVSYIIAGNLKGGREEFRALATHEVKHQAMVQAFERMAADEPHRGPAEKRMRETLGQVAEARRPEIEALMREQYGEQFNSANRMHMIVGAAEWLADAKNIEPKLHEKFIAAVRDFLRGIGERLDIYWLKNLKMNNAEIKGFNARIMRDALRPGAEIGEMPSYAELAGRQGQAAAAEGGFGAGPMAAAFKRGPGPEARPPVEAPAGTATPPANDPYNIAFEPKSRFSLDKEGVKKMLSGLYDRFINQDQPWVRYAELAGKDQAAAMDERTARLRGLGGITNEALSGDGLPTFWKEGHETEKSGVAPLSSILGQLKSDADYRNYEILRKGERMLALAKYRPEFTPEREAEMKAAIADIREMYGNNPTVREIREMKQLIQDTKDYYRNGVKGVDEALWRRNLDTLWHTIGPDEYERLQRISGEHRQWERDAILKPLMEAGIMSKDKYQAIINAPENEFYSSFQREMDNVDRQVLGNREVVKQLKGSERATVPSTESTIANFTRTVRLIEANARNRQFVNLRDLSDDLAEVIRPVKANPEHPPRDALMVYENGAKKYYSAPKDIIQASQAMTPTETHLAMKILQWPAKALRAGATLTAEFMARNPIRDQMTAYLFSKYGYVPVVDFIKGFNHILGDSEIYREYRASGAEQAYFTALDRQFVGKTAKELMGTGDHGAIKYLKNPIEALRWLNEWSEKATRVGGYAKAREGGANPMQAMQEARDLTIDFGRMGSQGKVLNSIIAFWNANVQDMDKMRRAFKDRPGETLTRMAMGVTLPSLALWMLNKDEDWYKELPEWRKNMFWNFKIGDSPVLSLPKPFLPGILFGSFPERILDHVYLNDKRAIPSAIKDAVSSAVPGIIPTAALPGMEWATNHSFFRDQPIENAGAQRLPAGYRANAGTSKTMAEVGKMTDISPLKLENTIRDVFGGLGGYALTAADWGTKVLTGDDVPEVGKHWYEWTPGVKGFVAREPIGSAGKSVDDFYDNHEKTAQAKAAITALRKSGNAEEAKKYLDANRMDIAMADAMENGARVLSGLRQQIAAIQRNKTMGEDEKREKVDEISRKQTMVAARLNKTYESKVNGQVD